MNQNYRREVFQVATELISVKLNSRSTNLITIFPSGENFIRIIRGKVGVKYG